jgi:hypothetical protein
VLVPTFVVGGQAKLAWRAAENRRGEACVARINRAV